MIDKEFVPYEEALELKELGFDESCFKAYEKKNKLTDNLYWSVKNSDIPKLGYSSDKEDKFLCTAPLFQQAFRWFREKYDLFGCIDLHVSTPLHWFIRIDKIDINDYLYHSEDGNIQYSTYEEAELACLKKLIEIVKKEKQ